MSFSLSSGSPGSYTLRPTVSTSPAAYSGQASSALDISVVSGTPALTASISNLALTITGLTLDGQPSGKARVITITNTGDATAVGLGVHPGTLPTGTSISTTCGSSLAPSSSCTITVTPGANATDNCTTGTAPSSNTIIVSATGTSSASTNIYVLGYGCIYQGGYLFSIDDSTSNSTSIGGKVLTQTDQAVWTSPIVWSSNGHGGTSGNGSYDKIPGISEISTTSSSNPTFSSFSTYFAANYTNVLGLSSSAFSACNGNTNGLCNTNNILAYYNFYQTNYDVLGTPPFTATEAVTPLAYYAAGLCKATISGYSDWYLGAICEMGYDVTSGGTGCGSAVSPTMQNVQSNLIDTGVLSISAYYWTSTENSANASNEAWYQRLDNGASVQGTADKDGGTAGVRCIRALT